MLLSVFLRNISFLSFFNSWNTHYYTITEQAHFVEAAQYVYNW
jgi:hypothetical protein